MVEREEAALELLVSHQQLAKAVEPAVADLDHPAAGLLLRIASLGIDFLAAVDDVRDVAVPLDDVQALGAAVSGIGAQVLGCLRSGGHLRSTTMALRTSSSRLPSLTLAALTMSDSGTPRPSTRR